MKIGIIKIIITTHNTANCTNLVIGDIFTLLYIILGNAFDDDLISSFSLTPVLFPIHYYWQYHYHNGSEFNLFLYLYICISITRNPNYHIYRFERKRSTK